MMVEKSSMDLEHADSDKNGVLQIDEVPENL